MIPRGPASDTVPSICHNESEAIALDALNVVSACIHAPLRPKMDYGDATPVYSSRKFGVTSFQSPNETWRSGRSRPIAGLPHFIFEPTDGAREGDLLQIYRIAEMEIGKTRMALVSLFIMCSLCFPPPQVEHDALNQLPGSHHPSRLPFLGKMSGVACNQEVG